MKTHAPDMADEQGDHKDRRMLVLFLFVALLIFTDLARNAYLEYRPSVPRASLPRGKTAAARLERAIQQDPRTDFFLGRPMQVNLATAGDLELVRGIGPVLAKRIIGFRNQHGCIHNMKEFHGVRGIWGKLAARLKDQLAFDCP